MPWLKITLRWYYTLRNDDIKIIFTWCVISRVIPFKCCQRFSRSFSTNFDNFFHNRKKHDWLENDSKNVTVFLIKNIREIFHSKRRCTNIAALRNIRSMVGEGLTALFRRILSFSWSCSIWCLRYKLSPLVDSIERRIMHRARPQDMLIARWLTVRHRCVSVDVFPRQQRSWYRSWIVQFIDTCVSLLNRKRDRQIFRGWWNDMRWFY